MKSKATHRGYDCMPKLAVRGRVGRLAIVLGDQLNLDAGMIGGLDKSRDAVLMMEVAEESTHVPSHKQRTVLVLSAMRHFAKDLARRGYRVRYVRLEDPDNTQSFSTETERAIRELRPQLRAHAWPKHWRPTRTDRPR
jgi:deoxyribodipyrimidine photolyase-related protein